MIPLAIWQTRLDPFQRADALRQGRDLHQEQGQRDAPRRQRRRR